MKRFTESVISLALAGLIFYGLSRHFDLQRTMEAVRQARANLMTLAAASMVAAYLLRGARWRIWERGLSYWNSLRLILIGFMGNNILPARMGEVLRAHCAAAKTDRDRGRSAILGSIAAERILDGLVLGVFGLVAVALVPLAHRLDWVLLLPSLGFAVLAAVLVFSVRRHAWIRSLISAASGRLPGRLATFAREKASAFLDGPLPLGTVQRMLYAIAATAIIWGLETAACYLFGKAVWIGMTVSAALLFLVVVNFASLVPLTMGGIGTVEVAGPLFLISAGVSAQLALAMVLVQHAAQYFLTTLTGGIFYLAGKFHRVPVVRPKDGAIRAAALAAAPSAPSAVQETGAKLHQLSETAELMQEPRNEIQLSIVIPAYNEQARLPKTVLETLRWCAGHGLAFELIIVDDGSRDETLALARGFEESDARVRLLARPHVGKGAAVRAGALNTAGRFVLFMDADGATPLDEIPKLLAAMGEGFDVAIGSRAARDSGPVEVKTSLRRRLVGRTFALAVGLLAFDGIADTQCGFKMFRRDAAAAIFSRQKLAGFAFDVEILFIARRLSLSVVEIPVNWVAQPGSKVNLVTDSVRMLWDISRIRWMHRRFQPSAPLMESAQRPAMSNQ